MGTDLGRPPLIAAIFASLESDSGKSIFRLSSDPRRGQEMRVLCNIQNKERQRWGVDMQGPGAEELACAGPGAEELACLLHAGKLLRHEGWPLCLNDKIVVHLLEPQDEPLRPGEFLFYIVQPSRRTARLAIKFCIRERETEKLLIAEETYENLFSLEWLNSVNAVLTGRKLRKCVVTGRSGVRRMDWRRVAEPRVTTIEEDIETLAERASNTSLVSKTSSSSGTSNGSNMSTGNVESIGKSESDISTNSVGVADTNTIGVVENEASCNAGSNVGATITNIEDAFCETRLDGAVVESTDCDADNGNVFQTTDSACINVSNAETTFLDEAGLCEEGRKAEIGRYLTKLRNVCLPVGEVNGVDEVSRHFKFPYVLHSTLNLQGCQPHLESVGPSVKGGRQL
ncbi:hypothetical protein Bbelb_204480 [Branchiostoma belcheri]|nr:hypothetical protein Bbelb_204480 [Branchiostoma belcheri]